MRKINRGWLIFIAIQILIGTAAGFIAVSLTKSEIIPAGVMIGNVSVGDMSYKDAEKAIKEYYDLFSKQSGLSLSIDDHQTLIPFREIDLRFDAQKTMESIRNQTENPISRFVSGHSASVVFIPVFTFNAGKLSASLERLFNVYEKDAVTEKYTVREGQLLHQPAQNGVEIQYPVLQQKISSHLLADPLSPLILSSSDTTIFSSVAASGTIEADYDTIVSYSKVPLGQANEAMALEVLEKMNGSLCSPTERIMLSRMLDLTLFSGDSGLDFLNRFSTAVYQAFLPLDGIQIANRRHAKYPVPYAEPGTEAIIEGENPDLQLINNTGKSLMLLGEIVDGQLSFYVIATDELPAGILVTQKSKIMPPPVIESVNPELSQGESRVLSEGAEGFTVTVSRIIGNDRSELYEDRYEPVSKVVERGPASLKTGSK